jgi:hypothetical protein
MSTTLPLSFRAISQESKGENREMPMDHLYVSRARARDIQKAVQGYTSVAETAEFKLEAVTSSTPAHV